MRNWDSPDSASTPRVLKSSRVISRYSIGVPVFTSAVAEAPGAPPSLLNATAQLCAFPFATASGSCAAPGALELVEPGAGESERLVDASGFSISCRDVRLARL